VIHHFIAPSCAAIIGKIGFRRIDDLVRGKRARQLRDSVRGEVQDEAGDDDQRSARGGEQRGAAFSHANRPHHTFWRGAFRMSDRLLLPLDAMSDTSAIRTAPPGWLTAGRGIWIALFGLNLLIIILAIPVAYRQYSDFATQHLSTELAQLGLSPAFYASFYIVLQVSRGSSTVTSSHRTSCWPRAPRGTCGLC